MYDGPLSAGQLRALKPHAGCACGRIAQSEAENAEWRIIGGKPHCGDCAAEVARREAAVRTAADEKERAAAAEIDAAAGRPVDAPALEALWRREGEA